MLHIMLCCSTLLVALIILSIMLTRENLCLTNFIMITIQKGFIKIVYRILLVNSRASGSRHPWIYSPCCTRLKTINLFFMCNFDINVSVSRHTYLKQVRAGYRPRPALSGFLKLLLSVNVCMHACLCVCMCVCVCVCVCVPNLLPLTCGMIEPHIVG